MTESGEHEAERDGAAAYARLSPELQRIARGLIRDDGEVEDLVHDAWLAALEAEEEVRKPASWLRRVVRNLAVDRLTRRRRERAGRDEGLLAELPDPGESAGAVEAEAVGRSLEQALADLREPYATVLRLRYLEGLSHRELAARLGRSPETVKSQIKRGLSLMRADLDRRCGGDRAQWLRALGAPTPALVDRTGRSGAPVHGSSAGYGTAGAAAVLFLGAGAAWFGLRQEHAGASAEPARRPPLLEAGLEAVAEGEVPPLAVSDGGDPRGRVSPASAAPSAGAAAEADPAPPSSVTDSAELTVTLVRSDGLPPRGAWALIEGQGDRTLFFGELGADQRSFSIDPADFLEAPQVPRGVIVTAGAEGAAVSDMHYVGLEAGGTAQQTIALSVPAFDFRGRVIDAEGLPLEGARVRLRRRVLENRSVPGLAVGPRSAGATTAADGSFLLIDLAAGDWELEIEAPGAMNLRADVVLDEDEAGLDDRTWVLGRGASVTGLVRAGGRLIEGARVWIAPGAGDSAGRTESDVRGGYVLEGLAEGGAYVNAEHPDDPTLRARRRVQVGPDRTVHLDLDLERLPELRIRVLGPGGAVPSGARCVLFATVDGRTWRQVLELDAEGRATATHLPDEELTLVVMTPEASRFHATAAERVGVAPGPDELAIQLEPLPAPGSLTGQVLDANGRAPNHAHVQLQWRERVGLRQLDVDPGTGSFSSEDLLPGEYELTLRRSNEILREYPPVLIRSGEALDLGLLEPE